MRYMNTSTFIRKDKMVREILHAHKYGWKDWKYMYDKFMNHTPIRIIEDKYAMLKDAEFLG